MSRQKFLENYNLLFLVCRYLDLFEVFHFLSCFPSISKQEIQTHLTDIFLVSDSEEVKNHPSIHQTVMSSKQMFILNSIEQIFFYSDSFLESFPILLESISYSLRHSQFNRLRSLMVQLNEFNTSMVLCNELISIPLSGTFNQLTRLVIHSDNHTSLSMPIVRDINHHCPNLEVLDLFDILSLEDCYEFIESGIKWSSLLVLNPFNLYNHFVDMADRKNLPLTAQEEFFRHMCLALNNSKFPVLRELRLVYDSPMHLLELFRHLLYEWAGNNNMGTPQLRAWESDYQHNMKFVGHASVQKVTICQLSLSGQGEFVEQLEWSDMLREYVSSSHLNALTDRNIDHPNLVFPQNFTLFPIVTDLVINQKLPCYQLPYFFKRHFPGSHIGNLGEKEAPTATNTTTWVPLRLAVHSSLDDHSLGLFFDKVTDMDWFQLTEFSLVQRSFMSRSFLSQHIYDHYQSLVDQKAFLRSNMEDEFSFDYGFDGDTDGCDLYYKPIGFSLLSTMRNGAFIYIQRLELDVQALLDDPSLDSFSDPSLLIQWMQSMPNLSFLHLNMQDTAIVYPRSRSRQDMLAFVSALFQFQESDSSPLYDWTSRSLSMHLLTREKSFYLELVGRIQRLPIGSNPFPINLLIAFDIHSSFRCIFPGILRSITTLSKKTNE